MPQVQEEVHSRPEVQEYAEHVPKPQVKERHSRPTIIRDPATRIDRWKEPTQDNGRKRRRTHSGPEGEEHLRQLQDV